MLNARTCVVGDGMRGRASRRAPSRRPRARCGHAGWRSALLGLGLLAQGCVAQEEEEQQMVFLNGMAVKKGYAPWYCPPPGIKARRCAQQYRFGKAPPYIETTLVPMTARILVSLSEEPHGVETFAGFAQAMLTLLEAIRTIFCVIRFQACYEERVLSRLYVELCLVASMQQRLLAPLDEQEQVCDALFARGDAQGVLRAVSGPLQQLVRLILPEALPPGLGNGGTRFDFEHFFAAQGEHYLRRMARGVPSVPSQLVYPALFSPGQVCVLRPESRSTNDVDVNRALHKLSLAGVPLSRFAVNFGAANGVCGANDDWDYDPANCLAQAGYSAVLMEGNADWFPRLRERYGGRENVSLVLKFVELRNVTALMRWHLEEMPTADESPDLLKVDVDHADCLFMEEALKVLSPKLLHVEYAPQVPPPLDYAQHYQPRLLDTTIHERAVTQIMRGEEGPAGAGEGEGREGAARGEGLEITGCSLNGFLNRAPGYALVGAVSSELMLVRRDLLPALGVEPVDAWEAWKSGPLCHPHRNLNPDSLAWGFDFRGLAEPSVPEEQRLQELDSLLREHGASRFSLGRR